MKDAYIHRCFSSSHGATLILWPPCELVMLSHGRAHQTFRKTLKMLLSNIFPSLTPADMRWREKCRRGIFCLPWVASNKLHFHLLSKSFEVLSISLFYLLAPLALHPDLAVRNHLAMDSCVLCVAVVYRLCNFCPVSHLWIQWPLHLHQCFFNFRHIFSRVWFLINNNLFTQRYTNLYTNLVILRSH